MKKVIFVCLLSLSMCLSKAAEPVAPPPAAAASSTVAPHVEAKTVEPQTDHTQAGADVKTPAPVTVKTDTKNGTDTNNTQAVPVSNETTTKNGVKPADSSTGPKTDTSTTLKPVDPPKEKNETTIVVPAVKPNSTDADNKDGKKTDVTTTPKAETVSPSVAPVEAKSRAFDGPSFIGGIILTLGLLAIGFMGFKYYKNQTERNYHTL